MSGKHGHMHAPSTGGCAFVYLTVQNCTEYVVEYLYFKPRMSRSKRKSSDEVAGTAKKALFIFSLIIQVLEKHSSTVQQLVYGG